MAKLSIREAAKRFDVSRPTLAKRIKDGAISAEPTAAGGWAIDPADLIRAGYQARRDQAPDPAPPAAPLAGPLATVAGVDPAEVEALRGQLEVERARREAAEALAEERARHIEDFRRMLPAPGAAPARSWWPWPR